MFDVINGGKPFPEYSVVLLTCLQRRVAVCTLVFSPIHC